MPRSVLRPAAAVAALFVLGTTAGVAVAQTAGEWPGLQGGGAHTGVAPDGPAPPLREAWRFDPELTGRFGVSPPVIGGDVAVTVGPEAVYGVDLATGEAAWEISRDYGPSAAPALATAETGEVLIYTEGYGADPPSQAYPSASPTTGASAASVAPSPSTGATEGDGTSDASSPGRVVAVDLETQEPVWDASVELEAVTRTGVTVDGDTAYVGDDGGTVTAIDVASGEVRWTFDAGGPVSTPIAAAEDTVIVSTQPKEGLPTALVALTAADGTEAWRLDEEAGPFVTSTPAIFEGTVYLGFLDATGSKLRAMALEGGGERWQLALASQLSVLTAPVVTSEAVFAIDLSGQVHAVSPTSGEELWDYAINALVPRAGASVASTLLVPTARGSLLAIDTQSHDLIARATAAGPQGYLGAMAVGSDVVVLVKGGHHAGLVAFGSDAGAPLLSVPSPTVLDPGRMVANFAIVAVPLLVLLALAGRWLLRRMGPAFADDDMLLDDDVEAGT